MTAHVTAGHIYTTAAQEPDAARPYVEHLVGQALASGNPAQALADAFAVWMGRLNAWCNRNPDSDLRACILVAAHRDPSGAVMWAEQLIDAYRLNYGPLFSSAMMECVQSPDRAFAYAMALLWCCVLPHRPEAGVIPDAGDRFSQIVAEGPTVPGVWPPPGIFPPDPFHPRALGGNR